MYTLKIKWYRTEGEHAQTVDESTLFIPADTVTVHGEVTKDDEMKHWPEGSFQDYRVVHHPYAEDNEGISFFVGRLINVVHNNVHTTYLATHAWLLGPNGDTIERIAP